MGSKSSVGHAASSNMKVCVDTCSVIYYTLDTYIHTCVYYFYILYRTVQGATCCVFYLALLVSRSLILEHMCVAYSHFLLLLHTVPRAVSGPNCAALLPAVVALAVALLTVLLLLVAAVFTAILFYTSESIIIVLTVYDSVSARPSTQGCALVQAELHNSKLGLMPI